MIVPPNGLRTGCARARSLDDSDLVTFAHGAARVDRPRPEHADGGGDDHAFGDEQGLAVQGAGADMEASGWAVCGEWAIRVGGMTRAGVAVCGVGHRPRVPAGYIDVRRAVSPRRCPTCTVNSDRGRPMIAYRPGLPTVTGAECADHEP